MFKFGGWKASLNFSGSSRRREVYENGPVLSSKGEYRSNMEEFYSNGNLPPPPKIFVPSQVKLPPSKDALKPSKSANDLTERNLPPQIRKSSPDVSTDPRGGTSKDRGSSALFPNAKNKSKSKDVKKDSKEKKKGREKEKKRIAEQKKRDKLEQEQAKQDKLRIQKDKKIAEQQAKDVKARKDKDNKNKKSVPQAPKKSVPQAPLSQASATKALVPQVSKEAPQPALRNNPLGQATTTQYSTNTLESSISRSSGPPPYAEQAKPPEKHVNKKDSTGNTSFSKPIENSSWDLISEHRNQMTRNPVAGGSKQKQMVMDLQFSFGEAQANDAKNNSEV